MGGMTSKGPVDLSGMDRRFFEAAWMHKFNGRYYLSYSTGDTHFINYATADTPYGPFTFRGRILEEDGASLPLSNDNPAGYAFSAFALSPSVGVQ